MSEREAGRFRGNLFGGFNRKDVLAYIASVYEELGYVHAENEMLRVRCEEMEGLLSPEELAALAYPAEMPLAHPADSIPEEAHMFEPDVPIEEVALDLDQNTLATPEDLRPAAPPVPPAPPLREPVPPVYEVPRPKPNLANPYPERARKVKVRPARES